MAREFALRDAAHASCNEPLKAQNNFTFHVVKTVADFAQQLAAIHEQQAEELQTLVETFRKRNAELRRERPLYQSSLFSSWETFLQEVEVDSQIHSDIASTLGRQVSVPLLERTFHRKVQSRKVFTHRESYETILNKTEELLYKCYKDYADASQKLMSEHTPENMSAYYTTHNAYVQQLHAANAMIDEYHQNVLPQLLDELEDVYLDLSATLTKSITECADVISAKAREQLERYENLRALTRNVVAKGDLSIYIKSLGVEKAPPEITHHEFAPLQLDADASEDHQDSQFIPTLGDEVVVERSTLANASVTYDALRKELTELHIKIRQLQEALDALVRLQQRSVENNLYNKANELQEDISLKRFDLRVTQIHLAAVRAQVELLGSKVEEKGESSDGRDRKMSSSSTGSMKSKWLKAFKSLKTGGGGGGDGKKNDRKGGGDTSPTSPGDNFHLFQEYTFKKIASCDVCKEILRGHTRQGLRCKLCKATAHVNCQAGAGRCNPKSRLLRRQRSTSEIETQRAQVAAAPPEEDKLERVVDPVYQLLKQAVDLGGKRVPTPAESLNSLSQKRTSSRVPAASLTVTAHVGSSSISAPHSPQRQKLNLRMKSLSLDSPESNERVQRTKRNQQPSSLSSSHSQSPQSPVHSRRLLAAKSVRMNSVDLPDDNEKSFSSASTSPCPSPKPHRLLPTNLYVVLYNFRARQADELDLKAGETITVIDTSDPDWWKGKGLRRGGFFPSKYVAKLNSGEKPLQVMHNLQVGDGDNGLKLLREQIVIQMGDEKDGMVLVRSGERQGFCPLRYLQEV